MNLVKSDIAPFRMYGNIYFIGSSRVSVHLLDTECGLVIIDTGYPDMYEQILDSMKTLGFEAENICAIFHSHGHIDHFGCTPELKKLSGAKTYISSIDNDIVNGTYNLSVSDEAGIKPFEPFNCDVLVEDGDTFTFGNTVIRCKLTPGHTEGVLSFFIEVSEGKERIVAAMHGGIGINSMTADFLNKYGLSFSCRDIFRKGLHELSTERVALVLGNHPHQNDTEGKLKKVLSGESVIDFDEWQRLLEYAEKNLDKQIAAEN